MECINHMEKKQDARIAGLEAKVVKLDAQVTARDEVQLPLFRFNTLVDFIKKIEKVMGISKGEGKKDIDKKTTQTTRLSVGKIWHTR